MRLRTLLLIFLGFALLLHFTPVHAANQSSGLYGLIKTGGSAKYNAGQNIQSIVALVVRSALSLLVIIFFGLSLYAGLRWMTARGNEEFVTRAKDTLTTSITGLIIVVSAYALTTFVLSRLNL